jgi:hypothetical protein
MKRLSGLDGVRISNFLKTMNAMAEVTFEAAAST